MVMASGGTGLMHESYWFADSSVYTRFWSAQPRAMEPSSRRLV